jgi:chromosome segregation ATPase
MIKRKAKQKPLSLKAQRALREQIDTAAQVLRDATARIDDYKNSLATEVQGRIKAQSELRDAQRSSNEWHAKHDALEQEIELLRFNYNSCVSEITQNVTERDTVHQFLDTVDAPGSSGDTPIFTRLAAWLAIRN